MADDYEEPFLSILNNMPADGGAKPRNRGFVVIVPGNKSLAPLEQLCKTQRYNSCYTARYRVSAGAVFGTVLAALVRDLLGIADGRPTQGVFTSPQDRELADSKSWEYIRSLNPSGISESDGGVLSFDQVHSVLQQIDDMTGNATGLRLVLFCEVVGEHTDTDEWERARTGLFPFLPERVGLVFSGAPDDFRLVGNAGAEPPPDDFEPPEAGSKAAMA